MATSREEIEDKLQSCGKHLLEFIDTKRAAGDLSPDALQQVYDAAQVPGGDARLSVPEKLAAVGRMKAVLFPMGEKWGEEFDRFPERVGASRGSF